MSGVEEVIPERTQLLGILDSLYIAHTETGQCCQVYNCSIIGRKYVICVDEIPLLLNTNSLHLANTACKGVNHS